MSGVVDILFFTQCGGCLCGGCLCGECHTIHLLREFTSQKRYVIYCLDSGLCYWNSGSIFANASDANEFLQP